MFGPADNTRSIFAPIAALAFSAQQEKDCAEFIATRGAHTEIVPISDEAQLTLKANGRICDNNYRFNQISFLAVCQAISGGLSRVFGEISGEAPSKFVAADDCSIPAAVSIYNTALRVRFDTLRERSLILDHSARAVDGFIGLNHKLLENTAFFTLLAERTAGKSFPAVFHRAELRGRELLIYYINPETRRNDIHEDPEHTFATGWYFCNREDSGNAIRAIPCLFTRFGPALLPERRGYRLVHVGSDLLGKTATMVERALNYSFDLGELQKRVARLREQKLGFAVDGATRAEACNKWGALLMQRGAPKNAAAAILKNTFEVGADSAPRNPLDVFTEKAMTDRSVYDLFCSTCRYARQQPTVIREKLQELAAELILPPVKKRRN